MFVLESPWYSSETSRKRYNSDGIDWLCLMDANWLSILLAEFPNEIRGGDSYRQIHTRNSERKFRTMNFMEVEDV